MKVILLIGIPGSGKSFFSAWLKRRWPCDVVSSDEERERIWGCRFDSSIKESVLKAMLEKCRASVSARRNVVLDSTYFNSADNRRALYAYMAGCDAEFIAIEFSTATRICEDRDSQRRESRRVGPGVIARLVGELELPADGECARLAAGDASAIADALGIDPRRRLEILAPSGCMEQLEAAVGAGCDAVYGGLEKWNARGRARNFSPNGYIDALRLCHESGVKFYLTLNTLLRDDEIDSVVTLFSSRGLPLPDAFIVADAGLMASLKASFPLVPIHVSTQGGVATPEDALFYRALGASRLILARELNLSEIERIREASGLEIEVFAYGSQCVAFSGQCMWGALMHGCSGNRGCCIGMCRDAYEAGGRIGNYLYPRDLSAFGSLGKMAACGVSSVKIEGRMRRPEEIADVVTALCEGGEGERVVRLGGNYNGFLGGERPDGMFASEHPRGSRAVKSRFTQPFSTELANVSLKAVRDASGGLAGFDFIDDNGCRNSIEMAPGDRREKMSVAELAAFAMGNTKANVYEFTSDMVADEYIGVSMPALRKALEQIDGICGTRSVHGAERVDFSPERSLCSVSSMAQLNLAKEFGFREFILPWRGESEMERALAACGGRSLFWELPAMDFRHAMSEIASVLSGRCQGVVVPRISQLEALGTDFPGKIIMGTGGNVWNGRTIEILKSHRVSSAFLTPELPVGECSAKMIESGLTPIVSYWGRMPVAVCRGCFKATGACNGECRGLTGRLRNVGKGYDLDLFCDAFSDTRTLVPEKTFFSGNEIGVARKCVSFRWMDDDAVGRCLKLNAEGGLEGIQNVYMNGKGAR